MSDENPFATIIEQFYPYRSRYEVNETIPATGRSRDELLAELRTMATEEDRLGDAGRCSGSIYSGDHEHYHFMTEAFETFAHSNVLQRDMYPSANKLEGEIVAMTLDMLNAGAVAEHHPGQEPCGVLTSGGSESLISAVYAYREWAREERGITDPQMIMPRTAHVALDKGAHYFGVEVLHAPVGDDHLVDVDWVREHITDRTILLVGSAGSYPYGLVDPISELGALADEHGIGLHVDGCLGGFILPWGQRLGYDIPPFDFTVPGVTSISADTHKYGYALKGTSVLMYRDKNLRKRQYFTAPGWPGGLYLSPGISGSRSGGLIAATWASLVSTGQQGYLDAADAIFSTAAAIRASVESIPELSLMGDPTFLVAFQANPEHLDQMAIFHVNDALIERGWRMNALHLPPALHFCVTRPNTQPGVAEQFDTDLRAAVEYAKNPASDLPRSGALYGFGGSPEGTATLDGLLTAGLDLMYALPPKGV
ncbi:MAG: aminotransferase class V-fold PLP-dependent enzyme [Jiangellales bacterium]